MSFHIVLQWQKEEKERRRKKGFQRAWPSPHGHFTQVDNVPKAARQFPQKSKLGFVNDTLSKPILNDMKKGTLSCLSNGKRSLKRIDHGISQSS